MFKKKLFRLDIKSQFTGHALISLKSCQVTDRLCQITVTEHFSVLEMAAHLRSRVTLKSLGHSCLEGQGKEVAFSFRRLCRRYEKSPNEESPTVRKS